METIELAQLHRVTTVREREGRVRVTVRCYGEPHIVSASLTTGEVEWETHDPEDAAIMKALGDETICGCSVAETTLKTAFEWFQVRTGQKAADGDFSFDKHWSGARFCSCSNNVTRFRSKLRDKEILGVDYRHATSVTHYANTEGVNRSVVNRIAKVLTESRGIPMNRLGQPDEWFVSRVKELCGDWASENPNVFRHSSFAQLCWNYGLPIEYLEKIAPIVANTTPLDLAPVDSWDIEHDAHCRERWLYSQIVEWWTGNHTADDVVLTIESLSGKIDQLLLISSVNELIRLRVSFSDQFVSLVNLGVGFKSACRLIDLDLTKPFEDSLNVAQTYEPANCDIEQLANVSATWVVTLSEFDSKIAKESLSLLVNNEVSLLDVKIPTGYPDSWDHLGIGRSAFLQMSRPYTLKELGARGLERPHGLTSADLATFGLVGTVKRSIAWIVTELPFSVVAASIKTGVPPSRAVRQYAKLIEARTV